MSRYWDNRADMQVVERIAGAEDALMEQRALYVADTLTHNYPNYPWVVGWHDGQVLAVKLLINKDFNYGYTIDAKGITGTALAHEAKLAGGELLERMGLPRGAWDGTMPTKTMDGVDAHRANPLGFDTNTFVNL